MLFVKNDLKRRNATITHGNILKDDLILIFSSYGNHGVVNVSKSENLFLQFFSLDFLTVLVNK
jgi:hypothetical protein